MYRMVPCRVSTSQARDRALDAAVEHALRHGIVDLSLREIAAAIGTSHRMLIYHFGSREGLLVAVVREVERRERETLTAGDLSLAQARLLWDRLADPSLRGQERLFFEIYSHALLNRPGTEGFLGEALDSWISPIVASMTQAGVEEPTARAVARLGLAVTRGLLLDLLASGDRDGTTQAFHLFTTLLEQISLP
jgi:AcrR family transcriptional regulator